MVGATLATMDSHIQEGATVVEAILATLDSHIQGATVVTREGSLAVVHTSHRIATVATRSHRVASLSLKHPFRKFLPKGM